MPYVIPYPARFVTFVFSTPPSQPRQCLLQSFPFAFREVSLFYPVCHPLLIITFAACPRRCATGITGGFAPPTPSAVYTVDGAPTKPDLHITAALRPDGTPQLGNAMPKSLSKSASGVEEMLSELHSILQTLPVEVPAGCEDIYRLDTSIAFQSGNFMWMNGGPRGCGTHESSVQPTAEDKARFKRAVEIVHKLVGDAK